MTRTYRDHLKQTVSTMLVVWMFTVVLNVTIGAMPEDGSRFVVLGIGLGVYLAAAFGLAWWNLWRARRSHVAALLADVTRPPGEYPEHIRARVWAKNRPESWIIVLHLQDGSADDGHPTYVAQEVVTDMLGYEPIDPVPPGSHLMVAGRDS